MLSANIGRQKRRRFVGYVLRFIKIGAKSALFERLSLLPFVRFCLLNPGI